MDFGSGRLAPEELQHRVGALALCFIAYADGVPAGTASLDIRDVEIDGKPLRCAFFKALGVLPKYAGMGIATRLFEEREKAARALFCRRIYVCTHPHNQRAIDLFLRLGYRRPDPEKAAFEKDLP